MVEVYCSCVVCRMRKKFNSKHGIQESEYKLGNLYRDMKITNRLEEYVDEIEEIHVGKTFKKIQKDFDKVFHELTTFVHLIQSMLDSNKVLEHQRILCFDLLLVVTEQEHCMYIEYEFRNDRINIGIKDFVKLEDNIRNLEKQKQNIIEKVKLIPLRIPEVTRF